MEQNEDLIRLAEVVEDLLANYNQLKKEKADLLQTISDRDCQIKELDEQLGRLQNEKHDVSKRVSGILSTIQDWEKGLVSEEKKESPENPQKAKSESIAHLFSMEA
ncbi:MAG: hypothetical protein BM485_13715 [Desulfobulbaceae bacterium DB1]|nr:MAG: hypothetical protein BM485_13715 [Desulfobulbaceae bacterium DB1]